MIQDFAADGRLYGPRQILIAAEIGTAHGGDPVKAAELIDAAAEAGADCAKFQCIIADEIIHPNTGIVSLPGGDVSLYERFKALELDQDFYAALKEKVEAKGLMFLCSPFGLASARLLRRIGAKVFKVASPELNHLPLLDELASYGMPTILSSGVSKLADIERAAGRFAAPTLLLHCVTAYPAPEEDYNLRMLPGLASVLGLPLGVSDHSLDPVLVPALAAASGAIAVEKHICLSRSDKGLDDSVALDPPDFAVMVRAVREVQAKGAEKSLAQLSSEYGRSRIEAVLGDGVKRLARSEAANYQRTNRSIHALGDIGVGEIFSPANVALLRTEKILRPGLGPEHLYALLGRRARRPIASGQGIEWDEVGDIA